MGDISEQINLMRPTLRKLGLWMVSLLFLGASSNVFGLIGSREQSLVREVDVRKMRSLNLHQQKENADKDPLTDDQSNVAVFGETENVNEGYQIENSQKDEFFEERAELIEEAVEVPQGWLGYLSEKGPSQLFVKQEEVREPAPLPQDIWNLIMGQKPQISNEPEPRIEVRKETIKKPTVEIKKEVVDTEDTPVEVEKIEINKDVIDNESMEIDDEAKSREQLMDLFSRPVFATPTRDFGETEGMISFRVPKVNNPPTLRDGSRARFEIRKN